MLSTSQLSGLLLLSSLSLAVADSVWDYAPNFANDPFPPFPSLKNPDGTNITVESLRGTHLFGWKGCSNEDVNGITEAYNDFYTLTQQPEVYNSIDWTSNAATDFWGPNNPPNVVPDNTRKEIQQIFAAAQQVYSYPWTWQPWWLSWRQLWIEIRCSDGKLGSDSSDPGNVCGDVNPNDGNCPGGSPPVGGGENTLEAFSDPDPDDSKYSRITFCNDFFKLQTFKDAIAAGNKSPANEKTKLENWNNRARCFFHEITHLDYFMNAGDDDKAKSPYVSDLEVYYTTNGKLDWHPRYGAYNAKVLRNWVDQDPQYIGYFTQRNADSYAYFALAKYVEGQIGKYPSSPSPGRKKPQEEPRDTKTHQAPRSEGPKQGQDVDLIPGDEQDPDDTIFLGCGDKVGTDIAQDAIVSSISSQYAPSATATPGPKASPKCNVTALSGVPYNVFSGSAGSVFGKFCDAVGKAQQTKLSWYADSSGNQKTSSRLRHKRTPPPNPDSYTSFNFELDWVPASGACNTDCNDAYNSIALSSCGHQGGEQNGMTASASLDVGCGTYSYKITGLDVPAPTQAPAPTLSVQYCFPAGVFGSHGDIDLELQEGYTGWACAGSIAENFKPGDKLNWNATTNGVPYNYNVWWKDWCTSSVNPMNVDQPLPGNKDANCVDLMLNNYKNCNNGGIGGSISVGCLNYEFKASLTAPGQT